MQTQAPVNRLAELREARGEQRWQLSAVVRRDPSTIWRWEMGKSPIPPDAMRALTEHYAVTAEHLLGWDREAA